MFLGPLRRGALPPPHDGKRACVGHHDGKPANARRRFRVKLPAAVRMVDQIEAQREEPADWGEDQAENKTEQT